MELFGEKKLAYGYNVTIKGLKVRIYLKVINHRPPSYG
jgi:hypothetical protein